MFQMVIERLFLPELSKVDENDKKVCAIGVTHLLSDPTPMINGIYFAHLWLPLLQALLQLFESSNELQTMSAAERKKQALEEAEEELLVGLDDTPGKDNRYAHTKRERGKNKKRHSLCHAPTHKRHCLYYFRLHPSFFMFGFREKASYRYI
jgi:hypothetical protein